jgi:hypothetical protein
VIKKLCLTFGAAAFLLSASASQQGKTEEKETRTLKVKLAYNGSGTVDEKHKIIVFLFDSPDFVQGSVMPSDMRAAKAKDETVTFSGFTASPVFVVCVYDPTGSYEGMSPPPSGSSMGMYSKTPGQPEPVKVEPGKTVEIELAFDDSNKMP